MSTELVERYGSWAVVAGSSTGLGEQFARHAAQHGFNVVLIARRAEALTAAAKAIEADFGVETRTLVADLSHAEVGEVVANGTADLDVGLFIYNAAAEPQGLFANVKLAEHLYNLAVNCTSPTILCHHFARRMRDKGEGAIVLVSSTAALQGIKMFASYGASKAYEMLLGESLWDELRGDGIDAMSYVVGSTASPELMSRTAEFMHDLDQVDDDSLAMQTIRHPKPPTEVAARLFECLGDGPRVYSHELDEKRALIDGSRTRGDVVSDFGKTMEAAFKEMDTFAD